MKFQDLEIYKDSFFLLSILENSGAARGVGGAIRDMMLGIEPHDFDIATTLKPEEVINVCNTHGIKSIPTGIRFGTITALINERWFEITTLRRDDRCDGRHTDVSFTEKWEEDASRRDFTINALYMDKYGNFYDYKDGFEDIKNRTIRFIGSPEERIAEDHLRILRYFRFLSYVGIHVIDKPSMHSAISNSCLLSKISGERIRNEMLKLLLNDHAQSIIEMMYENEVLTEIAIPKNLRDIKLNKLSNDSIINLAYILFVNDTSHDDFLNLCKVWRLSNNELKRIQNMLFCKHKNIFAAEDSSLRAMNYTYGYESIKDVLMLQGVLFAEEQEKILTLLQKIKNYSYPKFPINGSDIMNIGAKGIRIGELAKYAKEEWINSDFKKTKDELIDFIISNNEKLN